MTVLAIDPGPTESAAVTWDGERVGANILRNDEIRRLLEVDWKWVTSDIVAIEKIASYGMAVGENVFETCYESGRMIECAERAGNTPLMVPRRKIKLHICQSARAKDANIIAALVDRFGDRGKHGKLAKGTKKNPGFFFGFKSHHWAAFALAVTVYDQAKRSQ